MYIMKGGRLYVHHEGRPSLCTSHASSAADNMLSTAIFCVCTLLLNSVLSSIISAAYIMYYYTNIVIVDIFVDSNKITMIMRFVCWLCVF